MPELTKTNIAALVGFFLLLISIPISTYLAKDSQIFRSRAQSNTPTSTISGTVTKPRPVPTNSPLTDLQKLIQGSGDISPTPTPDEVVNLSFGPTLNLKVTFEGRPADLQSGKIFVGISAGRTTKSPQYIITFSLDIPNSGEFKGLSLAGLDPGSIYTVYIKGAAQIDSSATFTMSPSESVFNNNQPLMLISGDLNEDNTINASDYTIARNLYGTTPSSKDWNERADLNKDGVINSCDLTIITKNIGKTGSSGTWISTPPAATSSATPSATLSTKPNVGGAPLGFGDLLQSSTPSASAEPSSHSSYWIYVP